MAWLPLIAAIVVEVAASSVLKLATSSGSSGPLYTAAALGGVLGSYLLLAWALRLGLDISLAYALWSGAGTAAIAVLGAVLFGEHLSAIKSLALALIIAGVVLLPLADRTVTAVVRPTPASAASTQAQTLVGSLRDLGHALAELPALAPAAAGQRRTGALR
ncbi:multidrug efflux SMR transporter [Nonomuraea sp. NPDC049695]|uniref:DMT family transporter n=1 Tax=Nonomuraea sp. NPDC049695 TaxID=3154734 RepID=UPI00343A9DB6